MRDIPIGNGHILVAFDSNYRLREFHFPYVGEQNHAAENFRIGIFIDGAFSWTDDWEKRLGYLDDSLVSDVYLTDRDVRIQCNDLVDFEKNLYLKKCTVENLSDNLREAKIFFVQDFQIFEEPIGDTAAFRPECKAALHYKGERYFLINIFANNKFGIDFYATGDLNTFKDAEDGNLSMNPISQGAVNSAIAVPITLGPKAKESFFYWIAAGRNWEEVKALNTEIQKKTPAEFLRRTDDYWRLWANKEPVDLPENVYRLYKRSLLICRTQMNHCGSIIAANDSDSIHFNRDTYSYMWPRDGALVANALDSAGYNCSSFFLFAAKILEKDGYFLHKYSPSGSLGSSWHPWLEGKHSQLPIQEDSTALVIWALWNHYQKFKDLELIRPLYDPLIKKAADFMMNFRDLETGLPLPSFDLWEERQGVFSFTAGAVFGALMAASNFAKCFGEISLSEEYETGAQKLKAAIEQYLYLPNEKRFARMLDMQKQRDPTIDASVFGLVAFGAFSADDEKIKSTMNQVFQTLNVNCGIIRYENDFYYKQTEKSNPWFVTTLWKAQYLTHLAKTKKELEEPLEILKWTADRALPSGVLAEQIHPETLQPISVSPLTWSHGTFIQTVQDWIQKWMKV